MRLIGAHMIGEQAIELIDIGLLAIQMNATFQAFIDACFNFPSLAELYKYATYDAMKRKQQGRVQGGVTELSSLRVVHGGATPAAKGA
jgi:NAD(P) transhydrogenase